MDTIPSFKSAVRKALDHPLIVDDPFHFCRYIYWALDKVSGWILPKSVKK
ncbi:transposase [Bacillus andreraoultii]